MGCGTGAHPHANPDARANPDTDANPDTGANADARTDAGANGDANSDPGTDRRDDGGPHASADRLTERESGSDAQRLKAASLDEAVR